MKTAIFILSTNEIRGENFTVESSDGRSVVWAVSLFVKVCVSISFHCFQVIEMKVATHVWSL